MSELLDGLVDDDDTTAAPTNPAAADGERENLYGSVFEFVGFLAQVYATDVRDQRTDFRWCPRWFHHTEAIARLEACWKAFEVLRLDPGTGAGIWFRDFADPAMNALTAPAGPFSQCSATRHNTPQPLPLAAPPAGLM